jgi:hypothetical protein
VAKGWSERQGNGPAFIYLAKDENDQKAAFLCEYFKGELENDQLLKYYEVVKKDLEATLLMKQGKMDQNIEDSEMEDTSDLKDISASEVKPGMKIRVEKENAEVLEVGKSRFGNNTLAIKVKFSDGATETLNVGQNAALKAVIAETAESLNTNTENLGALMEGIEELQEDTLEKLISNSLTESYGNVAGFRLNECSYLNKKLTVEGTIFFTSGVVRKTAYTFTEAFIAEGEKINLRGLNEKLGLDRQFTITGRKDNKTFIAESFNCIKK